MKAHRKVVAVLAAAVAAAVVASVGAAGAPATRERVAIESRLDTLTGRGTFRLHSLAGELLKFDSGTLRGDGNVQPSVVRNNGQRVTVITGRDAHTGKLGTFEIVQRIESVNVGSNYHVDRGTWTFRAGTGVYEGMSGGGAFAAAGLPSGIVLAREEGYLRRK